ncbi:hypothetical protein [Rubrivivax benzoatilyticus]|nr:hypothetical protein [Rubrivivax benzoatilyticus]
MAASTTAERRSARVGTFSMPCTRQSTPQMTRALWIASVTQPTQMR